MLINTHTHIKNRRWQPTGSRPTELKKGGGEEKSLQEECASVESQFVPLVARARAPPTEPINTPFYLKKKNIFTTLFLPGINSRGDLGDLLIFLTCEQNPDPSLSHLKTMKVKQRG